MCVGGDRKGRIIEETENKQGPIREEKENRKEGKNYKRG